MSAAAPVAPVNTGDLKERVAAYLKKDPLAMTPIMARELGASEAEVIRASPADQVTELNIADGKATELIKTFEKLGRVHVIATNDACTLEGYGYFGGFSLTGPFFNVQTDTLDMHIRHQALASAFSVIKPSHQDGQTTYSVQFFTKEGKSGFKVFLYKSVTEKEGGNVQAVIQTWKDITAQFKK
ncbi:MAG TPA: ChuX/HutX family heme-like substrate-binding protein [Candidatus Sumerlaeota bacterium]|nr:ChuX/HutX family heme-like substrate-binding protein [Candidatus Sumerlaeota bacterium]